MVSEFEDQIVNALRACVAAMRKSEEEGSTEHLDAHDDGGAFWYDAIRNAKIVLDMFDGSTKLCACGHEASEHGGDHLACRNVDGHQIVCCPCDRYRPHV